MNTGQMPAKYDYSEKIKSKFKSGNSLKLIYIILILVITSVILSTSTVLYLSIKSSHLLAENVAKKQLTVKLEGDLNAAKLYLKENFGKLSYKNGKLLDSKGKSIEGRFEMVDRIAQELGDVSTIFVKQSEDFVRVITSIKKVSGTRAIGTNLGKDSAAYVPIMSGKPYIGEAKILEKDYVTGYEPLKDSRGNVIGILFVGVEKAQLSDTFSAYLKNTIIPAIGEMTLPTMMKRF